MVIKEFVKQRKTRRACMTIKDIGRGAASGTLVDYGAPREQRSFLDVTVCSNRLGTDGSQKFSYLEEAGLAVDGHLPALRADGQFQSNRR